MKLRYKLSILNFLSALGLLLAIVLFVSSEPTSDDGGWGLVFATLLGMAILVFALVDFVLQQIFENRIVLNLVEVVLMGALYVITYF